MCYNLASDSLGNLWSFEWSVCFLHFGISSRGGRSVLRFDFVKVRFGFAKMSTELIRFGSVWFGVFKSVFSVQARNKIIKIYPLLHLYYKEIHQTQ